MIYDDGEALVDFRGVEFDSFSEEVTLRIWCRNRSDENRKFWISEITVNGKSHATWELIGQEEEDSDYCDYTVSNVEEIDYEEIETTEFQIEVDDDDDNEIGMSKTVSIRVDTDDETFNTKIR